MIHREQEIIQWGIDRNILGPTGEGTMAGQLKKTKEEVDELAQGIHDMNQKDVRDAIGDIIVTLIMQANLWNLTLTECIDAAWNQIKDRKGRMAGGVFVKE